MRLAAKSWPLTGQPLVSPAQQFLSVSYWAHCTSHTRALALTDSQQQGQITKPVLFPAVFGVFSNWPNSFLVLYWLYHSTMPQSVQATEPVRPLIDCGLHMQTQSLPAAMIALPLQRPLPYVLQA